MTYSFKNKLVAQKFSLVNKNNNKHPKNKGTKRFIKIPNNKSYYPHLKILNH